MKKYWSAAKQELQITILAMFIAYICGILLKLAIHYDTPDMWTFFELTVHMESFFTMTAFLVLWILRGSSVMKTRFFLTISMGKTRKYYIRQEVFSVLAGTVLLFLFWLLLCLIDECYIMFREWYSYVSDTEWVQTAVNNGMPPMYVQKNLTAFLDYFSNYNHIMYYSSYEGLIFYGLPLSLMFCSMVIALRLLLGGLVIRFGRIIYYILWGGWAFATILSVNYFNLIFGKAILFLNNPCNHWSITLLNVLLSYAGVCLLRRKHLMC